MKNLLFVLTLIAMLCAAYTSLIYAPTEIVMGHIQRIFYFHMGTVWAATLAFIVVFVASIMYLLKEKRKWDILAYSSAEIGVLFITLTIITGSIWAKPIWGTWWTWDPQLTTTFILWVLYVVYLLLRSGAGKGMRAAKYSSIFAIIAFIDLPLVYVSARLKRGISPVVFGPGGGGIAPEMLYTLLISLTAFTLLFTLLLKERVKIITMKDILDNLKYNGG
ncbi:MAG: cytochrome c biogenesis protein [Thermodesulfobacteriota bacterium]